MAGGASAAVVARRTVNARKRETLKPMIQQLFDEANVDGDIYINEKEMKIALSRYTKEHKTVSRGATLNATKFKKAVLRYGRGSKELDFDAFSNLIYDMHANPRDYFNDPPPTPYTGSMLGANKKLPYQDEVFHTYYAPSVVGTVALIIMANFIVNVIEKEIDADPDNPRYPEFWANADNAFNIIFIIELFANIYSTGGPIRRFWASGWNVFDTVIVTVSFLTMINALQPPLDQLKLLRAFRVFRLFKRVKALNQIIVSLFNSIPGVSNAFLVLFIFFCIYSILAVEIFRNFGMRGVYRTYDAATSEVKHVDATTPRGLNAGLEYYGTFMKAMFTMFQLMTTDSWTEGISRPLFFGFSNSLTVNAIVTGAFFVSFSILTSIVIINIVVAVLLDNFVDDSGSSFPPPDDDDDDDHVTLRGEKKTSKVAPAPPADTLESLPINKRASAADHTDGGSAASSSDFFGEGAVRWVTVPTEQLLSSLTALTTALVERKAKMNAMQKELDTLSAAFGMPRRSRPHPLTPRTLQLNMGENILKEGNSSAGAQSAGSAAREDSPDSVSTIAQEEDNNPIKKLEEPSA
jgi:hypothetical protein